MSWGWNAYGNAAGQIADNYGIPQPIFFGLIQHESNWNPFAVGDNGAAYGFGQLHAGAAADTGVNRFDPIGNLTGAAAYLKQQFNRFGNWSDALGAYNQGAGGYNNGAAKSYTASVMDAAKGFLAKGASAIGLDPSTLGLIAAAATGSEAAAVPTDGSSPNGQSSCFLNPVCYLRNWMTGSKFFERLGLGVLALIVLAAAFYLMNRTEINSAVKTATIAA